VRFEPPDPAAFIRTALRAGRAKLDGRTTLRGQKAIRFQLSARFGGHSVPVALYFADANTYRPIRIVIPPPHARLVILSPSASGQSLPIPSDLPPDTLFIAPENPSTSFRLGFPMDPSFFLVGFPGYAAPTLPAHAVYDFEDYRLLAPTADNRKLTSVQAMHPDAKRP
jgi:hypothetical protein